MQNLECDVSVWIGAWHVCLLNSNHFASLLLARFSVGRKKKKVDSVNWLSFSIILTFFIAMLQSNPSTLHLFQIFNKIYENYKME